MQFLSRPAKRINIVKKIVHLVVDDKFIDSAINIFSSCKNALHIFAIESTKKNYTHIQSKIVRQINIATWGEIFDNDVAAVIFHGLPINHFKFIAKTPPGVKIVWLGWGYDYYGLLNNTFKDGIIMEETSKILDSGGCTLSNRRPYKKFTHEMIALASRIDIFSPVLEIEFNMIKKENKWMKANYFLWNYGTLQDDIITDGINGFSDGENIMVGNSASPMNNHVDVFKIIKNNIDLAGKTIVCPLSYGDKNYANKVIKIGADIFGKSFDPITSFISKDAYVKRIMSCNIFALGSIRQQALGNIFISGFYGREVFLHESNPISPYLKKIGFSFGNLQEIGPQKNYDKNKNRDIVADLLSKEKKHSQTYNLINLLIEN